MNIKLLRNLKTGFAASPALALLLIFILSVTLSAQTQPNQGRTLNMQPATKVGRYRLQSNPWVNLHQRLLYEANFKTTPPASLSGENLSKWREAVETYRRFFDKRNPIFDNELQRLNAALSNTSASKLPDSILDTVSKTLETVLPLYRMAQWEEDDRANRFWIAVAVPLLESAGEELAAAHAKAYAVPFPTNILVDVSPFAWEFGAYSVGEGDYAHAVISSTDPGNQGFAALESLMHEPSHSIVDTNSVTIGGDITKIAKELGVKPRHNLWHAILFYTAGELTRRALAKRGVTNYQLYMVKMNMYAGFFQGLRQPLETHWQAYIDGKVSREAAIRQILIEIASIRK